MTVPRKVVALFAAGAAAACTTPKPAPPAQLKPMYTHAEHLRLTNCVDASDAAWYIAGEKLAKVPQERVETEYGYDSDPIVRRIRVALVKEVFADHYPDAVFYASSYFDKCARDEANIPASRVQMAHYCYYRSQVATIAWQMKSEGRPKEKALASPYVLEAGSLKRVVERVYATPLPSRGAASKDEWNQCMSILLEGD